MLSIVVAPNQYFVYSVEHMNSNNQHNKLEAKLSTWYWHSHNQCCADADADADVANVVF